MRQHYLARYLKLCAYYKANKPKDCITELHHIIPRCMNGDDSDLNIVELPVKAHIIAHELLYKALPNNKKIAFAFRMMCLMKCRKSGCRKPSLRQITKAREVNSRFPNQLGKPITQSAKLKMSEAKLGKPSGRKGKKNTESSKRKVSDSLKELYANPYNHPRTDMTIYHFAHKDGRTYAGKIVGMIKLFPDEFLKGQRLKDVAMGRRKSHKGWQLLIPRLP